MFSSYLVFVSLAIEVIGLMKQGGSGVIGLIIGSVFFLGAIIYQVFLYKKPEFFGEFKDKFDKQTPNYYFYNMLIIERIIGGIILALITAFSY